LLVAALWENDAITLAQLLRSREVSAREVIAAHIARIEAADGAVNAVVTRCFEQAMTKATAADQALGRCATRPVSAT
jgi:amidase